MPGLALNIVGLRFVPSRRGPRGMELGDFVLSER